jgi:acyl-CoA thioester hydrolase
MSESGSSTFRTFERVRWADVDLVGIMRYSAFTRLVEFAEQELLRDAGLPFSEMFQAPDVWLPRRQLTLEYFAPARIDELLELEAFVSRIGETSMTYQVDVRNENGLLIAAASLVVVCVTAESFAKAPLPREYRKKMLPYLVTVEAARSAYAPGTR